MGMQHIIAWYQKKIGNYDEGKWEKSLEHKNFYTFSPVDLKSGELKSGLIDIDLVRGSSFTKPKPKHGFFTITRYATLRFLFFPFYIKWWLNQTSTNVCCILLITYLLQLFNIGLFIHNTSGLHKDSADNMYPTEITVPIIMMWVLSMIHSQIVATNPISENAKAKLAVRKTLNRKRFSKISSSKLHLNFPQKRDIPRCTLECLDDGFESFNGKSTSASDNEVLSSPDGKFQSRSVGTDECFLKRNVGPDKSNSKMYLRYRQMRGHNWKKTLKKFNNTKENSKSNENIPYSSWKDENHSSSEEIESNSDSDNQQTVKTHNKPSLLTKERLQNANFMNGLGMSLSSSNLECIGATTNSDEEVSYSSDLDDVNQCSHTDNTHEVPSCIYSSDKVICTIWHRNELKEASLSVLDISSIIVAKVESMPESMDYFYFGIFFSVIMAIIPTIYRICNATETITNNATTTLYPNADMSEAIIDKLYISLLGATASVFEDATWEHVMLLIAAIQRFILSFFFCFLLTVAERTFKQRFLYAKFFSHLTSSRRAKKSALPHFRLNKVCNIRIWLSVRSYLKKRGPQRSVDVIVSAAFIIELLLLSFLSMELLKDSAAFHSQYNFEVIAWSIGLGVLLLRFMTLGTKINYKYVNRNLLILTTEQINLYLQIEQNPDKKDKLTVANNVLKLAADLLKDTESPFMILGLSANPYLYAITKLVILSALSGVLSEMLGFKLKLHKIKVK